MERVLSERRAAMAMVIGIYCAALFWALTSLLTGAVSYVVTGVYSDLGYITVMQPGRGRSVGENDGNGLFVLLVLLDRPGALRVDGLLKLNERRL